MTMQDMTMQEMFEALSAPFPTEVVQWRIGGGGKTMAYVDARDVMDRLDTVAGPGSWQRRYLPMPPGTYCCEIAIRDPETGEWIAKADGADGSQMEAIKGGYSDAFKRSAVNWGVGRYLYDLKKTPEAPPGTKYVDGSLLERCRAVHDEFVARLGWGGTDARTYGNAVRLVDAAVKTFVLQPEDAVRFRQENDAVFRTLPKAARERIFETLDRIGNP